MHGVVACFRENHAYRREPAATRHGLRPSRPPAAARPSRGGRGKPLAMVLRAKRHSALPCPDGGQQESEPQSTQIDCAARWVGRPRSPKSVRMICVICGSNPCPALPHRRRSRFARPARRCDGAHLVQARTDSPLTPPRPRRQRATPVSASPAAPLARYTCSQRAPAAPASSCSLTPGLPRRPLIGHPGQRVIVGLGYLDSAEIRKTACHPRLRRFCVIHDPPWFPGQRIAPRPD